MPHIIPLELHSPLGLLPTGRLQLFTLLNPFFGSVDAYGVSKKSTATTVWRLQKLLSMWRRRVEELGAAGWEKARYPVDRDFLMNCMPTACKVNRRGSDLPITLRMCNRPNICPWCWARRASTSFERMEKKIFPYASPLRLATQRFALDGAHAVPPMGSSSRETLAERSERFDIVFLDRHRHLLFDDQVGEFEETESRNTLTHWLDFWKRIRSREFMKRYKPWGAIDFFVVGQNQEGGCSIHFRHLIIYPTGEIPDIVHNPQSSYGVQATTVVSKPTRGELIDQYARVFRYPQLYMDAPNVARVAIILNTLDQSGIRPLTQFGAMSSRQTRYDANS